MPPGRSPMPPTSSGKASRDGSKPVGWNKSYKKDGRGVNIDKTEMGTGSRKKLQLRGGLRTGVLVCFLGARQKGGVNRWYLTEISPKTFIYIF